MSYIGKCLLAYCLATYNHTHYQLHLVPILTIIQWQSYVAKQQVKKQL